jgi:prepilin-type N-terminal cleavage/methylation domain-containing protein
MGEARFVKRSSYGFTLVEVILALTILVVVTAATASCLMAGMGLWDRATRQAGIHDQAMLEIEEVSQELRLSTRNSTIPFEGTETQITFPSIDADGAVKVSYRFDTASAALFRSRTPFTMLDHQNAAPEVRVGSFKRLSFSYLSIDKSQEKPVQLTKEWTAENGPFMAVRIEGEINGENFSKTTVLPDKV